MCLDFRVYNIRQPGQCKHVYGPHKQPLRNKDKVKDLTGVQKQAGDGAGFLSSKFESLAKTLVAAFAVERIIAFGKASIQAFIEAEQGEIKLLTALGGRKDIQERLIIQAKELQKVTGVSDDTIVTQQAFLASQNRTEDQIKKTIKAAVELSKVTGESLDESVRKLDGTYEGVIGRLGKLDSGFKNLTQEQLANGAAVDLVIEKYGGFAAQNAQSTQGALAKLAATFNDLEEAIGKTLNKGGPFISFLQETFLGLQRFFTSNFDAAVQGNIEKTTAATDAFIQSFKEFRASARERGDTRSDFELAAVQIKEANESIIEANQKLTVATTKEQKARLVERITILAAEKAALESFLKDEEAARKAAADVGVKDAEKTAKQAAEDARKLAEEQIKARESLRQFTLKAEQDNITDADTAEKTRLQNSIQNQDELQSAFLASDLETLEKRKALLISFGESATDIEKQIQEKQSRGQAWYSQRLIALCIDPKALLRHLR